MESFLKLVAADLYKHTEGNLAHTAVVFPNKRAGLFFNEYLAQESESPIWSPAYVSISELFRSLSPWEVGDPVKLVCELYKIFRRETQSTETLDDFYFWGEMLISDFDDADKNKVDTDKLFSNLQDLRNIMDDYTFIDDEQEEAIRQFFQKAVVIRQHRRHPGLLQHHLAEPHMVGGGILPEGQTAAVLVKPVQEGRRNVFHLFCAPC